MISFITFAAGLFTVRAVVSALVFLGLASVLAALLALWGWGVF